MTNAPAALEVKCRRGIELFNQDKLEEAAIEFRSALKMANRPHQQGALLYNLALCRHKKGDKFGTLKFLEQAMKADRNVRYAIYTAKDFPDLRADPEFRNLLHKYMPSHIWLGINTYVRVPIVLILLALGLFFNRGGAQFLEIGSRALYLSLDIGLMVFYSVLFYGLFHRRYWAWYMIWAVLAFDSVVIFALAAGFVYLPNIAGSFVLSFLLVLAFVTLALWLVWIWPNYVYFMKRRYLFTK